MPRGPRLIISPSHRTLQIGPILFRAHATNCLKRAMGPSGGHASRRALQTAPILIRICARNCFFGTEASPSRDSDEMQRSDWRSATESDVRAPWRPGCDSAGHLWHGFCQALVQLARRAAHAIRRSRLLGLKGARGCLEVSSMEKAPKTRRMGCSGRVVACLLMPASRPLSRFRGPLDLTPQGRASPLQDCCPEAAVGMPITLAGRAYFSSTACARGARRATTATCRTRSSCGAGSARRNTSVFS